MTRLLAIIFIALAMSFAPLAMRAGAAMAAPSAGHHAQMSMQNDHCADQQGKSHDGKASDKDCCIAMCTAITVASAPAERPIQFARSVQRPSSDRFRIGYLARLPTPPPRRA